MAGEPSIVKITDALATLFAGLTDVNILPDRSDSEPIQESERPAMALRFTRVEFETDDSQDGMLHRATLDMDFYEIEATADRISTKLSRMIASANALIAADRTLGRRLGKFELREVTAELDFVPDYGCSTLTADLAWITRRDDFTILIGVDGTIF